MLDFIELLTNPMLSVPGELEAYSVCLHSVLSSIFVGQSSSVSRDFLFAQR